MNNLKRLRERIGLSQDRLGELSGVSRFAIIDYEAGRSSPTYQIAKKMAAALHCSLSDLDDSADIFRDTWQIRVIVDNDEWGSRSMNMTAESNNEVLVFVTPTKIGVQVVGKVEDDEEIEELLDRVRSKIKDAREFQKKSVQ